MLGLSFFYHTKGPYQTYVLGEWRLRVDEEALDHFNSKAACCAAYWRENGDFNHSGDTGPSGPRCGLTTGIEESAAMNNARQKGGLRPVAIRPAIPRADYHDEISPEQFEKLRKAVADINDPRFKRTRISGFDWPFSN